MNCDECEVLIHALIDGELDAGHARDVEAHVAACPGCAEKLAAFRSMQAVMADVGLKEPASAALRRRIEAALPGGTATEPVVVPMVRPSRRLFIGGFTTGAVLSGALAASLLLTVMRGAQDQGLADEIVSAHIRSLQAGHLLDVQTSDRHTVKPWFNGRLDVAPPVLDLTGLGFTLLGGRLDYVAGEPVAAIIYQRRKHVINLFVAQHLGNEHATIGSLTVQGYNVRRWSEQGLDFWAVSDLAGDELDEFVQKISGALKTADRL